MEARSTMASEARVPTAMPWRYLAQLGKHFRHRRPRTAH